MSILVLGHRGYRHDRFPEKYPDAAHENTLKAFEYAFQHYNGLETDIICSKQETIFLTHDTLFTDVIHYEFKTHFDAPSREIIGERYIFQMDDSEIEKLRMIDGSTLPKLAELFTLMKKYPDRIVNLELKAPYTNEVALHAVQQAIAQKLITADQINFSSFNLPQLREFRELAGDQFKIGALFVRNVQIKNPMFPNWPDINGKSAPQDAFYLPFILEKNIMQNDDLRAIDPDYFNIEYGTLTMAGVEAIDKFNPQAKIILWPAGEPHPDDDSFIRDIIEKFAPTGKIHAVMSDFPEILQKQLEDKGLADKILPVKAD
jgi:glycerophosphoryl diester phosphodiesterase